jgi:hypothetical protein
MDVTGRYEQRAIEAVDHRHLSDHRMLAAQILGRLESLAAVPRLAEIA